MTRILILLSLTTLIVSAAACGSSSSSPASPTTSSADVTVSIRGDLGAQSYAPNPATMKVGQTIAWHNGDSTVHTATGDVASFNTNTINAGANSAPIMMNTAGTFTYHCAIHPGMVGTITVQ
jgi:plastocyanin